MMALHRSQDSSGGRYPTDETLELLRASLARYLGGEIDEDGICRVLEVFAREAQERRLNAEHMLIAFKAIWGQLTEAQAIDASHERKRLLDHLVTFCIDAYYQSGT